MSCSECAGYGGTCPCCEEEPQYEPCEACNGVGFIYYVGEEEVPFDTYQKVFELVPKACECVKCEMCNGIGEIEVEPYEPDPDYAYESKRDDYGI